MEGGEAPCLRFQERHNCDNSRHPAHPRGFVPQWHRFVKVERRPGYQVVMRDEEVLPGRFGLFILRLVELLVRVVADGQASEGA